MLEDGVYDAIVVDADATDADGVLRLDLTILDGPHKGDVVAMRATGLGVDELEALGLPATLTVLEGEPSIVLDR